MRYGESGLFGGGPEARGLKGRTRHIMRLATSEHAAPAQLGAAVLVGVVVGMTPFWGLHLIICLGLALALRLNKVLTYAAAHVSVPPLLPLVAVACIQAGHMLRTGQHLSMKAASAEFLHHTFFVDWMLGSVVVGLPVGAAMGAAVWGVAAARRRQLRPETAEQKALARLHRAFLPEGRWTAGFVRGKARHDVVYREVLGRAAGVEALLDVGGGHGALALLMALEHPGALKRALVIDWDEPKLAAGKRAAELLEVPVAFQALDAFQLGERGELDGRFDCIACIDVLHYAPLDAQRALVGRLAGALRPGGRLLIRDMDADLGWRRVCTVVQEHLCLLARRTRASLIVPRSGADLERQLREAGLTVTARRCYGKTPFANTLWIAERPA